MNEPAQRNGWRFIDVALFLVGICGLAASLAVLWLGMRAVMGVGGFCAEGGPYVIAHHCPEGTAWLIPLAVFAGLGSAGLTAWKGASLGAPWSGLIGLAWPALFISLGWNFLEYGLWPGDNSGIAWGWLIPGILFEVMGIVPLFGLLPSRRGQWAGTADSAADSWRSFADALGACSSRIISRYCFPRFSSGCG